MQLLDQYFGVVKVVRSERHDDTRGFFSEIYNRRICEANGIVAQFVQDNFSLSHSKGVVRGLHFQSPPAVQSKLIRVLRGSILDVVVDIRMGSPTYGQHVAIRLDGTEWKQVFIPPGFAHGFCTLEASTEVFYKVDHYYSAAHDRGVRWNDPALGIAWPVDACDAKLSDKDRRLPALAQLPKYFAYNHGR